jgi:hypothetical protein
MCEGERSTLEVVYGLWSARGMRHSTADAGVSMLKLQRALQPRYGRLLDQQ